MNTRLSHEQIEMVPIAQINVLNPRARNRRIHQEIIENIRKAGLKRPIVVSRRRNSKDQFHFDLVCGQGRIEAFENLGWPEIPAIVVDADERQCLMLSVVENLARRHHRPIDQMREIGELRARDHSEAQIAAMIGMSASWVNMISCLLDNGEERLLNAVERERLADEQILRALRVPYARFDCDVIHLADPIAVATETALAFSSPSTPPPAGAWQVVQIAGEFKNDTRLK